MSMVSGAPLSRRASPPGSGAAWKATASSVLCTFSVMKRLRPPYTCASACRGWCARVRSEEHTSELQSQSNLVCRLLLEKKKKIFTPPPLHPYHAYSHPLAVLTPEHTSAYA